MTQRRVISFALFGALLAMLGFFFIRPLWSAELDYRLWRDKAVRTIATYQAVHAHEAEFKKALTSLNQHPLFTRLYVAPDQKSASLIFRQDIQSILAQAGLVSALNPIDEAGSGVAVECQVTTTIDHLQTLMDAFAAHHNFINLESVDIEAPVDQDIDGNPPLTVHLKLRGYWRSQASA